MTVALFASACSEREPYADAIWSDTDESWLVIRGTLERCEVALSCDSNPTILTHELWIYPVDGGEPRQLVGPRDGPVWWTNAYFMESAGYVLVERGWEWERISLDGEVRSVERRIEGSPSFSYVPSPDGSILARVSMGECISGVESVDCTYRVSFVDAHSLEPIGDDVVHRSQQRDTYVDRMTWNPEGSELYVGLVDEVFIVGVDGHVEPNVARPPCERSFLTTSSNVSSGGVGVFAEVADGEVRLTVQPGERPGFPDRCFPPAE